MRGTGGGWGSAEEPGQHQGDTPEPASIPLASPRRCHAVWPPPDSRPDPALSAPQRPAQAWRCIRGLLPSAHGPSTCLSPRPLAGRSSRRGLGFCAGRPYSGRPCRLGPAARLQSSRTPLSRHCHSSFQKLPEVGQILRVSMVSSPASPHPARLVWLTQPPSKPLHSPHSAS